MKKKIPIIILFLLFPALSLTQDTLKYRIAYYPIWAYDELPPWNVDWGGLTHIVLFTNGSITTSYPYWRPVTNSADSVEVEFGPGYSAGHYSHFLDSLVSICHRKGLKVLTTIQCVNEGVIPFDYVASDSIRTQVFWNTAKAWMIRKHIDGWDLDLEGESSVTIAQRSRFIRIGRRVCYDNAFPNGRALIGIAASRGAEYEYPAAQIDSMITFYDLQCYVYHWMWNGSTNATWFQTPVSSPASCGTCQNSSLSHDFLYGGKSLIDGWVAAGHDKKKIVIGYSTSLVTGFTGTDQLSAAWSNSFADRSLKDVEAMVNYGGTRTRNSIAKASYIAGTATSGNPLGLSTGTKFFLPFEDSTDIKAGIDYLKSVGCVGVMFYDFYGDRRIGQTENWKRTPYIYASSKYAAALNGGSAPSLESTITITPSSLSFGSVVINTISNEQIFGISGSNLIPANGDITVTAPTGFQISLTSGSGFGLSKKITYTGGTLSTIAIYVRFVPISEIQYNAAILMTGGSAGTNYVSVKGKGLALPSTPYSLLILSAGWNLVSVPRVQSNYSASVLFPEKYGNMFSFNATTQKYEAQATLANGVAYWVYYQDPSEVVFTGEAPSSVDVTATQPGWIQIGSRETTVDVSLITLSNGAMKYGNFIRYDPLLKSYRPAIVINPGEAAWVYVTKACTISIP